MDQTLERKLIKDVILVDPQWSWEIFQSTYIDFSTRNIKPNIVLLKQPDMEVYFETNSYGLKGPEVDTNKKLIVIWGDSVVFGLGKGWVEEVNKYFSDYQILNGGYEGADLELIEKRVVDLNKKIKIDYNIIFPGWHSRQRPAVMNLVINNLITEIPGIVLCTVPLSVNIKRARTNLKPYFNTSGNPEERFVFWSQINYTIRNALLVVSELERQNKFVSFLAKDLNIPVIDFYRFFYTEDINKAKEYFFDIGHFRPSVYPFVAEFFAKELKNII